MNSKKFFFILIRNSDLEFESLMFTEVLELVKGWHLCAFSCKVIFREPQKKIFNVSCTKHLNIWLTLLMNQR